jgi:hypothetical protein
MKTLMLIFAIVVCSNLQSQSLSTDTSIASKLTQAKSLLYANGKLKNRPKAVQLYMECANLGNIQAMNMLGYFYSNGIVVPNKQDSAIYWYSKTANLGSSEGWYKLGMVYKNRKDSMPNFSKAYDCYQTAANLGNDMGLYAQAYMQFKGLGCTQDYYASIDKFKVSANKGNLHSMYFLGLCYRNGYGTSQNADSANYWLQNAANKGYKKAKNELNREEAENSDNDDEDLSKSSVAKSTTNNVNDIKIQKLEYSVNTKELEGNYIGKIEKLDWSSTHTISTSNLSLMLNFNDKKVTGIWIESDSIVAQIEGLLTPTSIEFTNTSYQRSDRYSNGKKIKFNFQFANVAWFKTKDSIFIKGTIQMYSPLRNEPDKPTQISLSKKIGTTNSANLSNLLDSKETFLKTFPNPFTSSFITEFFIDKKASVDIVISNVNGAVVSTKTLGVLEAGYYKIPLSSKNYARGIYLISVKVNSKTYTNKILKL